MKLTKEEIKFIDNYLIKNEVKFWDVRLELLDHIVSAVEDKIENEGISFNEALLDVHRGFGNQLIKGSIPQHQIWTKGLYQSNVGFKRFVTQKQKDISRKQRKRFWKSFPKFLMSSRFILEFIACIIVVFSVHQNNPKAAGIIALAICYVPEISRIFFGVFDKSSRKSLTMQLSINISGLFTSLSYLFLAGFGQYYDDVANKPYIYMTLLFLFLFPFIRHSFNVYIEIWKENKSSYKLLTS